MHPEYTFESNYLNIAGNRLHYIDEGHGPAIVMVHGNPTWSFFYRKAIKLLCKKYRVIAVDHIGCGLSDKPQNYNYCLSQHIENLTALLNHLNIKTCSLMVHDWGGAIGMGYAVQNIQSITGIVILNTAAFRSTAIPLRISLCRLPIIGEFIVRAMNGFAWPATFMAVTKKLTPETKKHYLLPYDSWRNRVAIYRFVKDIPLETDHPSYNTLVEIEEGLKRIKEEKIPMLILWGGEDFCFTKEFYDEWKRRFPKAQNVFFENFGHYILEDGFDDLQNYLESFFLKVSAT